MNTRLRAILNRPQGDETEVNDKHSLFLRNTHDLIAESSCFFMKRLLRESALRQTYRQQAHCTEIVRCDSETCGNLGSVRIELVNFFMGKAVPGE